MACCPRASGCFGCGLRGGFLAVHCGDVSQPGSVAGGAGGLWFSCSWRMHGVHLANEIAELRGLVQGIKQRANTEPDTAQLDQLFSLISRSQQGYRDLIDTFEDLLFSVSNDGKILTINRSFADLLGLSFSDVIGRSLDEFFDLPEASDRMALEQWLPRFMQRRRWTGLVRGRIKKTGAVRYFDCVLHAIVRDDEVHGISGFARDVTKERESETRFTELFQTLREGVYLASVDDRITEVNPALAQMLGYENKEELLNRQIAFLVPRARKTAPRN